MSELQGAFHEAQVTMELPRKSASGNSVHDQKIREDFYADKTRLEKEPKSCQLVLLLARLKQEEGHRPAVGCSKKITANSSKERTEKRREIHPHLFSDETQNGGGCLRQ